MPNLARKPKRAVIQQKLHKDHERKLAVLDFSPPPEGTGVLYFYGSAANYIGFGWAENAIKVTIQIDKEERFLTALWAKQEDMNFLRKQESIRHVESMRGYVRWLRKQHFAVQDDLKELEKLPFVDPSLWRWKEDRSCSASIVGTQASVFDDPVLLSQDPFADILKFRHVPEDGYFTPDKISEPVREFFGTIDLDPASNALANSGDAYNKGIRAKKFYSEIENGLEQEWYGKVYLSPNFGEWDKWMPKLVHEWRSGRIVEMIVSCSGDSAMNKGFVPIRKLASAVFFSEGRFNYWGPSAGENSHGTILWYLGARPLEFAKAFARIGDVFVK